MRIKYIIHRSKEPFRRQKELFREIIHFYATQYPSLRFVDKGLRFSAVCGETQVDFDFGYVNMRYRDFSPYHLVISQGFCGLLAEDLNPGDMILPKSSEMLRVNGEHTKVRLYHRPVHFSNRMDHVMDHLSRYESHVDSEHLRTFVSKVLCADRCAADDIQGVDSVRVKREARVVESNCVFRPSLLDGAHSLLKDGEERIPLEDLRKHLQSNFDAVDCEAKQMIENVGSFGRLARFSIGTNKPYSGMEWTDTLRASEHSAYDEGKINYFLALFFGYILATEGSGV